MLEKNSLVLKISKIAEQKGLKTIISNVQKHSCRKVYTLLFDHDTILEIAIQANDNIEKAFVIHKDMEGEVGMWEINSKDLKEIIENVAFLRQIKG